MTESKDLWPADLFSVPLRAPAALLRFQAQLLSEKSGRKLMGVVKTRVAQESDPPGSEYADDYSIHSLRARVPDLGNYEVELVRFRHLVNRFYPVFGEHLEDDSRWDRLDDEAQVAAWVAERLKDDWLITTLRSLIAQANDPDSTAQPKKRPSTSGSPDYGDIPF